MRDAMWCAECRDSSHDWPNCPPAGDVLPAWLLKQIEAAEAGTRTLLYWAQQTILMLKEPRLRGKEIPGWHDWPKVEKMCQQRLAELDTMRQVLAEHDIEHAGESFQYCRVCRDHARHDAADAPCRTLRLMTLPFATQPGYQERWRL